MKKLSTLAKKAAAFLSLIFISTVVFGQNWTESLSQNGVKVYYQTASCDGATKVLLKFENTTGENQEIVISGIITTSTGTVNISNSTFNIPANNTIEGKCEDSAASSNFIYIGDASVTKVSLSL